MYLYTICGNNSLITQGTLLERSRIVYAGSRFHRLYFAVIIYFILLSKNVKEAARSLLSDPRSFGWDDTLQINCNSLYYGGRTFFISWKVPAPWCLVEIKVLTLHDFYFFNPIFSKINFKGVSPDSFTQPPSMMAVLKDVLLFSGVEAWIQMKIVGSSCSFQKTRWPTRKFLKHPLLYPWNSEIAHQWTCS